MNKEEKEILKALKVLGFKYIARDFNKELYAYDTIPNSNYYGKVYTSVGDNFIILDDTLFKFIKPTYCYCIEIEDIEEND